MERFTDSDNWRWYAASEDEYKAGRAYASVTTILDCVVHQRLKTWFKENTSKAIDKKLTESADIGTQLHSLIELDLKGQEFTVPDDLSHPFAKWKILKAQHDIRATKTEFGVKHDKYGYAGTVDILGYYDNALAVMDVKTGNYNIKAGWQMAAYRAALLTVFTYSIQNIGMVGLSVPRRADQSPKGYKYEHVESCWLAFLSTYNAWRMLYYNKLKNMNWAWLNTCPIKEV